MKCAAVVLLAILSMASAADARTLRNDVGPNTNATYAKECGSCHFPYQPGWLPERSWRHVMANLSRHFGENAEIAANTRDAVTAYLTAGAADRVSNQRSREVMQVIPANETPTSITKVLYVGGIHGGFLDPAFRGEPSVKTLSQCPACHVQAERGWFSPVRYTISDESFRSNEVDRSLSLPVPSFLRLGK